MAAALTQEQMWWEIEYERDLENALRVEAAESERLDEWRKSGLLTDERFRRYYLEGG